MANRHSILPIVMMAAGLFQANGSEAIRDVVNNYSSGYGGPAASGMAFQPAVPITVTALGYSFNPWYYEIATLEMLDVDGNLLAKSVITAAPPPPQTWHYKAIDPIHIPAGSTTYLVAYDTTFLEQTGFRNSMESLVARTSPSWEWYSVAPELHYLGVASDASIVQDFASWYAVGVNFQFTPEQSLPSLSIQTTQTNTLVLRWPASPAGFHVEAKRHQANDSFQGIAIQPQINGTNNVLVIPVPDEPILYRLRKLPF